MSPNTERQISILSNANGEKTSLKYHGTSQKDHPNGYKRSLLQSDSELNGTSPDILQVVK